MDFVGDSFIDHLPCKDESLSKLAVMDKVLGVTLGLHGEADDHEILKRARISALETVGSIRARKGDIIDLLKLTTSDTTIKSKCMNTTIYILRQMHAL